MIGDSFINKMYYVLSEANTERVKKINKKLYVYDHYNIRCFAPNPLSKIKDVPVHLVNALIHGLNEKLDTTGWMPFLPRFLIVVPDWDIVKYIGHYKFGITVITEGLLHWIISNMVQAVDTHCNYLARVKKGATTYNEPKVIWIKMVDRVACVDKALAIRTKFNRILENVLSEYTCHYIIDINNKMRDSAYFDEKGPTEAGAKRFWIEVDEMLSLFDSHDISLKPIKRESSIEQKFRMPPPPPRRDGRPQHRDDR